MTMQRLVPARAYGLFGAATTIIYMMAMFGFSNTLYSLALSTAERAISTHAGNTPLASTLSSLTRLLTRRLNA